MSNDMRKISPLSAILAGSAALVLAGTVALAAPSSSPLAAVPTNPTQQEALDGLETARLYIVQHPDAVLPTATTAPPTTAAPTTVAPTTVVPTTVAPTTAAPTTTSPANDRLSGMPWNSGTNPQGQDRANVTAFSTMRGKPVDLIVIHPSRDNWAALNANWAYTDPIPVGYAGHLSFSMPLWPGNGAVGTNYNADWTAWANRVEALDPKTDVRLGWEMNLPNPWSVNTGNRTAWVAAFNRAAIAIHTACPGCTVTFNPNWGGDQTGVDSRGVFQEVKANVDIYGIDYYDAYPAVTSDAIAASRLNASRGLVDSFNYAVANGKKFAVPEWGVACNTSGCQWAGNAGGDNPRFVNHVMNFLASRPAADIAYEAYFDEPASYIKSSLRAGSVNPNSVAAYRAQITALAH